MKEIQKRYLKEILHKQDVDENTKRLEKMSNLKKDMFLEKMTQEHERIARVQKEKEQQFMERKRLQEILEKEKQQVLQDFEKKKKKLMEGKNLDKSQLDNLLDLGVSGGTSRFQLAPINGTQTETTALPNDPSTTTQSNLLSGLNQMQSPNSVSNPIKQQKNEPKKRNSKSKPPQQKSVTSRKQIDVTPYLSSVPKNKLVGMKTDVKTLH